MCVVEECCLNICFVNYLIQLKRFYLKKQKNIVAFTCCNIVKQLQNLLKYHSTDSIGVFAHVSGT